MSTSHTLSMHFKPGPIEAAALAATTMKRDETVETRVWIDEFKRLEELYNDAENCSPKLRFPDLISSCVSVACLRPHAADRIFSYLHSQLILRDQDTPRRQQFIWRKQYNLLLMLQKSPMNCHPNPQFKLDHFTTACISMVMDMPDAKSQIFQQARRNIAERAQNSE